MSNHTTADEINKQNSRVSRRDALKLLGAGAVAGSTLGSLPGVARADPAIQKLTAADGDPGDSFGVALALDRDTALIGAGSDDEAAGFAGSAYVFEFDAATDTWSQQQKLLAADAAQRDRFGTAVALDGDTALVGAFRDNDDRGAAYVFTRSGDTWSQQQKLTADDANSLDQFGISVGLDGDTVIVGASGDSGVADFAGAAYVFTRDGGSFTQTQKLTASDAAEKAGFGGSVAVEAGTAIVGAPDGATEFFGGIPGSAYVFERSDDSWPATEDQKLTPSDSADDDRFGASIALDGDTAVIGSTGDSGAADEAGAAYVFTDGTGGWNEEQKLSAGDPDAGDHFGGEVEVDGDIALIGAEDDDEKNTSAGAAYVFTRDGSWGERTKLTATDPGREERFGDAVALDGTTGLVGGSGDDENGVLAGAVYVFPNLADLAIASLQVSDVRVVQTVEDTTLRDPGGTDELVTPDPPDLVAGRNTAVLFNLVGSSDQDLLPDDSTVEFKVTREFDDRPSTTDTFELEDDRVQALASETTVDTVIFNGLADGPPVFEATEDLVSIMLEINPDIDGDGTPDVSGDSESILVGVAGDIEVRSIDATDIGFIELADPTGGANYGGSDGRIKDNFDTLVSEAIDYIEKTYPVDQVTAHKHPDRLDDSSVVNTSSGGHRAIIEDMKSARSALEDEFPDVDFDVTIAFVPGGGSPGTEEGYPTFHRPKNGFSGIHYGGPAHPRASAVVRGDLRNDVGLGWYQLVVAQEPGHHFLPTPAYPDDVAMRVDDDKDGDVDKIDNAHARTESPSAKWSPTPLWIDSTGFDLTGGAFDLLGLQLESFMSYNTDDVPSWNDAHAYQTLLTSGLKPLPPEADGSEADSAPLLLGAGRVSEDDDLVFTRLFTREGRPMPSVDDGTVTLTVLDANGSVVDERKTPDQVEFEQATREDTQSGGVVKGMFTFAVPFPDVAVELRAEHAGTVTRLNPIERSLREAIARLPDVAFTRAPKGRRKALNNKLDELDEKMAAGEYRDAANKLEKDICGKLEKWLSDDYDTSALQPTKAELLTLCDTMIARLETLVEESND